MSLARILLFLGVLGLGAGSAEAQVAPHKAVYDLALVSISGSNSVSGASGKMVLNWTDVCDGWATELDLRVRLFAPEGEELRFGTAISSWESKDGRVLRFQVKDRSTYFAPVNMRGRAVLDLSGAGTADFVEPKAMTIDLPKGTLFPTAHSIAVLKAAEAGEASFIAPIFDGSEEGAEALMEASAAILGPYQEAQSHLPALSGVPYYKINLAFYLASNRDLMPEHEVTLRLYTNGVVDRQLFDYGDFVLAADISELTLHPDPGC